MEFLDGDPLNRAWSACREAQRHDIVDQLRQYLEELRGIGGDFIGSVDKTVCNQRPNLFELKVRVQSL